MRGTQLTNLGVNKSAKAYKISKQYTEYWTLILGWSTLSAKFRLATISHYPCYIWQTNQMHKCGILREFASHWWWERTNHVVLTRMGGSTPGILHYRIGCLEITERIVDRLGNKAEQKPTRTQFRIAKNWSVARMKSYCAEKYYSISDACWGQQIEQIEPAPGLWDIPQEWLYTFNRGSIHMNDKQYRKLAVAEIAELQKWTIVLEPLESWPLDTEGWFLCTG